MLKFVLIMMSLSLLLILVSSLTMMFDIKEKTLFFFNFVLALGICLFATSFVLCLFFLV